MKLKFDPSLQYQRDAVNAVIDVFDGQPFVQTGAMAFQSIQIGGLFQTELGMGNRLNLPDDEILKNVHAIQEANEIEKVAALGATARALEGCKLRFGVPDA
jgi:type III restriction enzyme